MTAYVVDASTGVKLYLVEPYAAEADRLFAMLQTDPPGDEPHVPDWF